MIFFLLFIAVVLLGGAKISKENTGYISKEQCNVVKGVCILLVFLRHAQQYINSYGYEYERLGDMSYLLADTAMGQLIVVMFLFYSGYGVAESLQSKGVAYWRAFPRKRILTTILNFDIAVMFFVVLSLVIGNNFGFDKLILSLLGWESMGNSNWYIFVIVLCYFCSWLAMWIAKKFDGLPFSCIQAVLVLVVFLFLFFTKESWWYDTIFAYMAGTLFSMKKKAWVGWLKKHYAKVLFLSVISFLAFWHVVPLLNGKFFSSIPLAYHWVFGVNGNICSVFLVAIIVLISMKIKLQSRWLEWCGKNLFPLYIYQRLGMIMVSQYQDGLIPKCYPYFFIVICFVASCMIAYMYKYIQIKL